MVLLRKLADEVASEIGQVAGGDMHVRVWQAGGIGEVRAFKANFGGKLVHHGGKACLGASDAFGQHDGRIIAGLDDNGTDQVLHGDLGIEIGKHGRTT